MIKRTILLSFILFFTIITCDAQTFIKISDLFPSTIPVPRSGELNIIQPGAVDTLVSRYILGNRLLNGGTEGFRIQIYRSSNRNAREISNKIRAEFMVEFPSMPSYAEYERPGYFLVRVGDFRTKMEGTKSLYLIRRKYPNAYMVPCIINFPDQIKN